MLPELPYFGSIGAISINWYSYIPKSVICVCQIRILNLTLYGHLRWADSKSYNLNKYKTTWKLISRKTLGGGLGNYETPSLEVIDLQIEGAVCQNSILDGEESDWGTI